MTVENQRLAIAASFAERYYNAMVESPHTLPQFYAPTASADHLSRKVKGEADVAKLLSATHSSKHYASITIDTIRVTCTTTGNVVANVSGSLHLSGARAAAQAFTHEVELRETHAHCYAITRDVFRHKSAAPVNQQTMDWASATPLMFAADSQTQEAAMEPLQQPATTVETHAALAAASSTSSHKSHKSHKAPAAAAAKATTEAEAAKPAEPAVDLSKLSFAERLRLTKGQSAQPNAAPIRVSDKAAAVAAPAADKDEKPAKKSEKKPERKSEKKAGEPAEEKAAHGKGVAAAAHHDKPRDAKKDKNGAAPARSNKAPARAAQPLVFYDIIVKGLPDRTTEDQVRALVKPQVTISKVKVESKGSRRDPADTRTFAFIQLEREGLTEEVKAVVASVIEHAKQQNLLGEKVLMEEVHERKPVPAEKQ